MTATPDRALDRNEAELVAQADQLHERTDRELTEMIKRLRARRDRAQRMIRTRARAASKKGEAKADTGAQEKKALLMEAIGKVDAEIKARRSPDYQAKQATQHLREAVERKAENPSWHGPDDPTPDEGPAQTPNDTIAPSGALHAEGMRVTLGRSMGRRS